MSTAGAAAVLMASFGAGGGLLEKQHGQHGQQQRRPHSVERTATSVMRRTAKIP